MTAGTTAQTGRADGNMHADRTALARRSGCNGNRTLPANRGRSAMLAAAARRHAPDAIPRMQALSSTRLLPTLRIHVETDRLPHVPQARIRVEQGGREPECPGSGNCGSSRARHCVALPDATVRVVPRPSGQIVPQQFRRCAHGAAAGDLSPFRVHRVQAMKDAWERLVRGFHPAKPVLRTVQPSRGRR